jgi:hypothetical protein
VSTNHNLAELDGGVLVLAFRSLTLPQRNPAGSGLRSGAAARGSMKPPCEAPASDRLRGISDCARARLLNCYRRREARRGGWGCGTRARERYWRGEGERTGGRTSRRCEELGSPATWVAEAAAAAAQLEEGDQSLRVGGLAARTTQRG